MSTAAVTPTEPSSVWEDFIDIFYAPSAVFRRRENGSWILPMAVVTIALVVIGFVTYGALRPMYDAMFDKAAEKLRQNPAMTEDMIERTRSIGEFSTKFGIIIFVPIAIFLVGLVTWLVGKLFGSRQTLHAALVVASYAFLPRVVGAIVNGVEALLMDPAKLTSPYAISIGPARFMDPNGSAVLLSLLGRIDVFTIWTTVLLAIGLAVTGRLPRSRAILAGVVIWLVGSFPAVMGALRQG